ncbi:hypothetical protein [Streptomyces sp. NBC_00893]|uniref:hypothetical protein n=1 Tax=Streptomyces sp. NBC_00893 TaxID=2975862 RepID=UPI002255770D|nr:hypothetical protein [Streptomyces sp. NBC_00893]MCX4844268.1 hypothetical protein [Streptomyces sp. NBC_00893]
MITEDDVNPVTLVAGMLRPAWRHDLYRTLDTPDDNTTLRNAIDRAASGAETFAAQLRRIVETLVAEGQEWLGNGFVHNPNMSEEYLLELCDRGVFTGVLGHLAGPRSLLVRMCEVHRYPESILTLGLGFYRDPDVRPDEFAAFVRRYRDVSGGWLLRALAETDPDSTVKLAAYEAALDGAQAVGDAGWKAIAFHARHLANAASSGADRLAWFLDRHTDAQVLALLRESRTRSAANCSKPAPGTRPTRAFPTRSGAGSTAGRRPVRPWVTRPLPHSPRPVPRTSSSCWPRTRVPRLRSCAS